MRGREHEFLASLLSILACKVGPGCLRNPPLPEKPWRSQKLGNKPHCGPDVEVWMGSNRAQCRETAG